jgi:hypothetical protein
MAKKDDKNNSINFGNLKKIATKINSNSDSIYQSTYYSDPADKKALDDLKLSIDTSIKSIMNNNSDNLGEPNISRMYERLFMNSQNNKETVDEFRKIFEDNEFMTSLTTSYMDNRWIKAFDDEIDEILKYFPKLEEALQTIKDNVLSSDSFSKDFLNMSDELQVADNVVFNSNIDEMKDKYDLLTLTNDTYYNVSKYGEEFLYVVPYETAIERLLNNKKSTVHQGYNICAGVNESGIPYVEANNDISYYDQSIKDIKVEGININCEVDNGGLISSIVEDAKTAYDARNAIKTKSLSEQFLNEHGVYTEGLSDGKYITFDHVKDADLDVSNKKLPVHHRFDNTLPDDFELPIEDTTSDGLVTNAKDPAAKVKLKHMNGCIVKRLPRERVIPIYINDMCLGYYYFEFESKENIFSDKYITSAMNNTITGLRTTGSTGNIEGEERREELIKFISSQLADKIDADFVNKNQDLKKEIYYILKYNDEFCTQTDVVNNMRCTYIPPEDIQHCYFKLDESTHRGISDLALSLIPAKLYVSIYITNALACMTRGNDKRVYYVKQTVETNIAKTLLKTINEIKKSNFGMRQVENINNVLDIVGRFNDYIVPRGPDGSSPIDFEVMQGQQIEIKTELLNILEEAAINVIGIPIEIIQNRQSPDYAVQLTMQNSKFLRFVYTRQSDYQKILSRLYTKIYGIEYNEPTVNIVVTLPPPLFINITNTNQLIVNVNDYCNTLVNEVLLVDEQDDMVKQIAAKELKIYHLGSYLNMPVIENIIAKARQQAEVKNLANGEEQ